MQLQIRLVIRMEPEISQFKVHFLFSDLELALMCICIEKCGLLGIHVLLTQGPVTNVTSYQKSGAWVSCSSLPSQWKFLDLRAPHMRPQMRSTIQRHLRHKVTPGFEPMQESPRDVRQPRIQVLREPLRIELKSRKPVVQGSVQWCTGSYMQME